MTKIALIGAGSVVFTRRLLQDVVKSPALAGAHVSLMDVNQERLDLVGRYAERLAADNGGANTVDATTDRAEALAAADYVITTIRVGDEPAVDHAIPLSYGVDQSVADTVGPGGVFKALRTIPVLLGRLPGYGGHLPRRLAAAVHQPHGHGLLGHRRGDGRQDGRAVPQRSTHDGGPGRLHRSAAGERLGVGGRHQSHGLVPEARTGRPGRISRTAESPGRRRYLLPRSGAVRADAPFRILS